MFKGGVGEDIIQMGTERFSSSSCDSCSLTFWFSSITIERGKVRSVVVERMADVSVPDEVEKRETNDELAEGADGGGNIKRLESEQDDVVEEELIDDEGDDEKDGFSE